MNKEHFLNRLNILRKEAFASFNYDQVPSEFENNESIPIECLKHGTFYQKPVGHLYGGKCPTCVLDNKRSLLVDRNSITTEDFVSKSKLKYKDRFNYSKTIYKSKYELITLTCLKHGDIEIPAFQHFRYNFGCPKCSKEIPLIKKSDKRLEKARKIHKNRYNYSRVVPCTGTNKVEIICPRHGSFFQYLYDHSERGTGCPNCSLENGKLTLEEFKTRSNELFKHQYTYEKVSFKEASDHVTITCKQHGDFKQRLASHLAGNGCKQCHILSTRKTKEEFIKDSRLIHGNKYDYKNVVYSDNKKVVDIICPIHGSFWQTPNNHLSCKAGCPTCNESKGEKFIADFLTTNGILFIREYKIRPHNYRFDFYLPNLDIFIEFNGSQHYRPVKFFGGEEAFKNVMKNDAIKKDLVKSKGSILIVLTYQDFDDSFEETIKRRLMKIYNFWLKKDAIEVFKNKEEITSKLGFNFNKASKKDFNNFLEDLGYSYLFSS